MIETKDLIGNWANFRNWNDYLISDNGEVYSKRRKRLLNVWKSENKYLRITISCKGKEASFCIHRLVAESFIPNPLMKKTVNHKDGNKHNNHVSNLEWATISENQKHAIFNNLAKVPSLPNGEKHPAAKLTLVDVLMIKVLLQHDFTLQQIASRFNIHPVHVSQIKLNKTWKHLNQKI